MWGLFVAGRLSSVSSDVGNSLWPQVWRQSKVGGINDAVASYLPQQETKMLIQVSDCWMLSIYKLSFSWFQNYTENNRKLQRAGRWWYFSRDSTLVSFIGCHLKETWDIFLCNSQYTMYCSHCLFCTTCPLFLSLLRVGRYIVCCRLSGACRHPLYQ